MQEMYAPNLFHFASGELSQDAFICWLLSWAREEHAEHDKSLYECALRFIAAMFEKHGLEAPHPTKPIKNITIKQQHHRIDVFCKINEYVIIIEDKTDTKNHSGQLVRYREVIEKQYPSDKILCIYYKTEEQGDYEEVENRGYKPFLRQDILKVLDEYQGDNDVLLSYRAHLNTISKEVESYQTWPLDKWVWRSWQGFYSELQSRLGDGSWDYVANPGGGLFDPCRGFLGFWWCWKGDDGCQQYLQLEQVENRTRGLLCFKIRVKEESERGTLRNKWHQSILERGENHPMLNLSRLRRFGKGEYMTVCVHEDDYRIVNKQNSIDMDKTLERLNAAMQVLEAAVEVLAPKSLRAEMQARIESVRKLYDDA